MSGTEKKAASSVAVYLRLLSYVKPYIGLFAIIAESAVSAGVRDLHDLLKA